MLLFIYDSNVVLSFIFFNIIGDTTTYIMLVIFMVIYIIYSQKACWAFHFVLRTVLPETAQCEMRLTVLRKCYLLIFMSHLPFFFMNEVLHMLLVLRDGMCCITFTFCSLIVRWFLQGNIIVITCWFIRVLHQ